MGATITRHWRLLRLKISLVHGVENGRQMMTEAQIRKNALSCAKPGSELVQQKDTRANRPDKHVLQCLCCSKDRRLLPYCWFSRGHRKQKSDSSRSAAEQLRRRWCRRGESSADMEPHFVSQILLTLCVASPLPRSLSLCLKPGIQRQESSLQNTKKCRPSNSDQLRN
jgi:hypothetical protein